MTRACPARRIRSLHEAKRNAGTSPDYAALHPGYDTRHAACLRLASWIARHTRSGVAGMSM
jgi:hypothetical protein